METSEKQVFSHFFSHLYTHSDNAMENLLYDQKRQHAQAPHMLWRIQSRSAFVGITLIVIDKRTVDKACAARCGIIAAEIPVARTSGDSLMESADSLIHQTYLSMDVVGSQHLCDFVRDFLLGKRLVDLLDAVTDFVIGQ